MVIRVNYKPGRCSVCNEPIPTAELVSRQVCLTVVAPAGVVLIQCWIDRECQPAPAAVSTFGRRLASEVMTWYGTILESDARRVDVARARS